MTALRIAVIGAGHMGRLHAAKIAALRDAEGAVTLAGVADIDAERAARAGRDFGARSVLAFRELLADADAAIVAVPTVAHFEVVDAVLAAGLDVLVEKPIAASMEQAEALLARAAAGGRVLQVGHLEWFNAALVAMRGRVRRPRFVEVHRMGPYPGRATDVDIVRDLMIHDIDIVQRLVGEEPEAVEGIGVPVLSHEVDIANARLRFPGGCVANFTASRVSPTPMRKMRFFQADGYFSIDFLAQSAVILRRQVEGDAPPRIDIEPMRFDPADALDAQLRDFLEAIRTRRVGDGGTAAALRALRTALRVVAALPPLDELA
ncbi:MAG: UDP-N-acetyl-D-glucosamine dehydrogenase [Proteobacteria bacterium]|nr:MAG: UDP-N-acetyl-D-glucosamine dehydrogenase [Pseudomonadota bacterium]